MDQNLMIPNIPNQNANLNIPPQGDGDNTTASNLQQYPIWCGSLCQNTNIMLNNRPCQVLEIPEVRIKAKDLLSRELIEFSCPLTTEFKVPLVTLDYYQVTQIGEDGNMHLKLFDKDDDPQIRQDLQVPEGEFGSKMRQDINIAGIEVYCTVIRTLGQERIVSVRSCPAFPDFERLPFEMKEEIFSFLKAPDLLTVRQVCCNWSSVVPISTVIRIYHMKIFCRKITMRTEPVEGMSYFNIQSNLKTSSPSNLFEAPPDLIRTVRHLELRERVATPDLNLILELCDQLHSIDLDYPTDETMDNLDTLVHNTESTLTTFSIWDYFWYNSGKDAFDCGMLTGCNKLNALTLFVKHIKNIELIPLSITCLKLDKVNVDQIHWLVGNMKNLRFLRLEVGHYHLGEPQKNIAFKELDQDLLKGLCQMDKMTRLDLNFSTKMRYGLEVHEVCPTVTGFEALCNRTEGITALSDSWDVYCTLEVIINRSSFKGFDIVA